MLITIPYVPAAAHSAHVREANAAPQRSALFDVTYADDEVMVVRVLSCLNFEEQLAAVLRVNDDV